MRSREFNMKSRLLCVLVLLIFAMGCKDEKKEKDDDETKQLEPCHEAFDTVVAKAEKAGSTVTFFYGELKDEHGTKKEDRDGFAKLCVKRWNPKCITEIELSEISGMHNLDQMCPK